MIDTTLRDAYYQGNEHLDPDRIADRIDRARDEQDFPESKDAIRIHRDGREKIYLAGRYSRRLELLDCAHELVSVGYRITSRWIHGNHQISDDGLSEEGSRWEREQFAMEDWQDVMAADCCMSFTEEPRSGHSRGGRHVEFGAALAFGKTCIVVGPRENVFHCLPQVIWYPDWEAARAALDLGVLTSPTT